MYVKEFAPGDVGEFLVLALATLATAQQTPPPVASVGSFIETVHNWGFPVMLLFEQQVFGG